MAPAWENFDPKYIHTFLAEAQAQRHQVTEDDHLGPWLNGDDDILRDVFGTLDPPALHHPHHQYPSTRGKRSTVSWASTEEGTLVSSVFSNTVPTTSGAASHRHRQNHHRGGGSSGGGWTLNPDDVPDIAELSDQARDAMHAMAALNNTPTTTTTTPTLRSCRIPCEFARYTGCTETFDASTERQAWIRHELEEHMRGESPAACLCWFCDKIKFFADEKHGRSRFENFHSRMEHIADHFGDGADARGMRPDFFFLDHLWNGGLISTAVFEREKALREGVPVAGLRPSGYRTARMVRDEEMRSSVVVDTRREERERRRAEGQSRRRH
ncbi:uncharacterized protein DNG_06101 [Cephalotrichum gorgonifer]|uniref:Uncharacterized protein n=1 Tax=Cephalotrichum gorgonifer TaxID=2041049 RepID=A0AAE8SW80_9PEZI|nr:uncharacterized protein DNG_06101 [Cephalotrichum gorgonifer]